MALKDMYRTALTGNKPVRARLTVTYEDGSERESNYGVAGITERYGTNPHQLFRLLLNDNYNFRVRELKIGKEGYSLTNIEDAVWATEFLKYCNDGTACAVMKHENPCGGAAVSSNVVDAFLKSWWVDWIAAFGSVVGFNVPITKELAKLLVEKNPDGKTAKYFIEAVAAPGYEEGALDELAKRSDLRILEYEGFDKIPRYIGDSAAPVIKTLPDADGMLSFEDRFLSRIRTDEDLLVKKIIRGDKEIEGLGVVSRRHPTVQELRNLRYAWHAAYVLRSNAVAIFKDGVLIGPGTGQQDRVRAVRYAIGRSHELRQEAEKLGLTETRDKIHDYNLNDAVLASEALFPYRDSMDAITDTPIKAVAETGGSTRDKESIEAADEHDITLIFTGERTFRH